MWRHTKQAREHVVQFQAQIGASESLPIGVNSDSAPQAPPSLCMVSTEAGAKRAGPPKLLRVCGGRARQEGRKELVCRWGD